jgi:hypothetical protein
MPSISQKIRKCKPACGAILLLFLLAIGLAAPAPAQAPTTRFVGSIVSIQDNELTIKTDAGETRTVKVPGNAILKRIAPGQKDLSTAEVIAFGSLASGDRVLIKLDPASTSNPPLALQVVAIKQNDLLQKQQQESEDWRRRSVGGLVKSVDASAGVVVISNGLSGKSIAIRIGKATILRRYAPDSVRFEDAKAAPLSAIAIGDQLRARGEKSADGASLDAAEIVSGAFRNLSGLVSSLDVAAAKLQIKDLATKNQVTIHITAQTQIRKLPEQTAKMLAARLNSAPQSAPDRSSTNSSAPRNSSDPQQLLNRLPAIAIGELKKGEAIMAVATGDDGDVNAIVLLTGVEPLLQAPAATNLLANWSLSSGETEAAQ